MDVYPAGTKLMVDSGNLSGAVTIVGSSPDALRFYWLDNTGVLQVAANHNTAYEFANTTPMSTMSLANAVMSADELTLYYGSANGIFVSTRANTDVMFDAGTQIASVAQTDKPLSVTADLCFLYLEHSDGNIYVARKPH